MVLETFKTIKRAARLFIVLTILTGFAYPLLVTGIGAALFPDQAAGSLVARDSTIIGSELLAQKFIAPKYFQPRPSAGDYATIPSAASNQGPTNKALHDAINERKAQLGDAPSDLITTSASGLDPHISPESANFQVTRIAAARSLDETSTKKLRDLIQDNTQRPTLGFLGKARVNVLRLNLQLDQDFP